MPAKAYQKLNDGSVDLTGSADAKGRAKAKYGLIHIHSLSATKTADALIDLKCALSWVMSPIGASEFLIGALLAMRLAKT
ncbi:hypothetical protein MUY35_04965 [Aliiroseovarius sp. S1339]|uniref:hypothetical protein n=1 Tax=Aliiroseovarius sp. S1339 TaxID=2936990 RepID=UPI0020C0F0A5|nr:hypothetical protein [Aliiroseovarius sp. S1339]MCK8463199.1 hypothetical protein [Aliiroseovarius sp. S1339]